MKINKRYVLLAACSLLITYIAFNWSRNITYNFIFFQNYSVTIRNKSDSDIVSVEIGIIKGASKDIYNKKINSGKTIKIKPELSLTGEGAIYMKYTDSRGATIEKTVCGYTESLLNFMIVAV